MTPVLPVPIFLELTGPALRIILVHQQASHDGPVRFAINAIIRIWGCEADRGRHSCASGFGAVFRATDKARGL